MGAWGQGNFENDDALDWLDTLTQGADLAPADAVFDATLSNPEAYIDAPVCSEVLAAAEVVAALHGKPLEPVHEALKMWMPGKPPPPPATLDASRRAVAALRERSELRDLWEESDQLEPWLQVIDDLLARLV